MERNHETAAGSASGFSRHSRQFRMRMLTCRAAGVFVAAFVTVVSVIPMLVQANCPDARRSFTAEVGAKQSNPSDSAPVEIEVAGLTQSAFDDGSLHREYEALVRKNKKKHRPKPKKPTSAVSDQTTTTASGSTTASVPEDSTTVTTTTTTAGSVTQTTTAAQEIASSDDEPSVTNGMQPFNYNDVSSIASGLVTLEDFVKCVSPSSVSWDASEYADNGNVRISLQSADGIVALEVRPLMSGDEPYTISGEVSGSVTDIDSWEWYSENSSAGCGITSVIWLSADFPVSPVREIAVGAPLADVTDNYLCVNGGATTLYRASDVLTDETRLNAMLSAENLYSFVGGRVYPLDSYLDKYYSGKPHTYRFEDADYIVQYGCNSIMEHSYTSGSWIIEYAIKDNCVTGITFFNKSYYSGTPKTGVSTAASSGSEGPQISTTQPQPLSDPSDEPETDSDITASEPSGDNSDAGQSAPSDSDVTPSTDASYAEG